MVFIRNFELCVVLRCCSNKSGDLGTWTRYSRESCVAALTLKCVGGGEEGLNCLTPVG